MIRTCRLLLVAALALSPVAAHAQSNAKRADVRRMQAFGATLDTIVPSLLAEMLVPGAAVALIADGRVVWSRGYGVKDVTTRAPVRTSTVFSMGSVSKNVAAWGLMHLVEQGRVRLDTTVDAYLTRWHLPPSSFDNSQVTLRRVLSHTAGLSLHGYVGWKPGETLPTLEQSLSGMTNGAGDVHVEAAPGAGYSYSGGGYTLAQLLVEEVTQRSFADYMRERVLRPLGMTSSEYVSPTRSAPGDATPHDDLGNVIPDLQMTELAAAGLRSTVSDMARFAVAGMRGANATSNGVLKQATVQLMQSPQPASPEYGLGYEIRDINGQRMVGHTGANAGWMSTVQSMPTRGAGLVVLTNANNGQYLLVLIDCLWRAEFNAVKPGSRCRRSSVPVLLGAWKAGGVDGLTKRFAELQRDSTRYSTSPLGVNLAAYALLNAIPSHMDDAIRVLTFATTTFPTDANSFDSLGEVYAIKGDTVRAIANYEQSLRLDPNNAGGARALARLKQKP